jgi:ethanolamine utilization microcompartment shell protein EutS
MALYHAIKVLGHAGRNEEFLPSTVKSVRTIKYCAIAIIAFVAGGEVWIISIESDDHAGGVMIGVFIAFASVVVATAMAVLERALQKALDMKSENDLTV